jgi:hypothetical protein
MFLEPKRTADTEQVLLMAGHSSDALPHANGSRQFCSRQFHQARLVIEQVDVGWRPRHEQVNHPLGARREMERIDHAK